MAPEPLELQPVEPRAGAADPAAAAADVATWLDRAVTPLCDAHPGHSGFYPLADGRDAFAARALLAESAERTIDAMYYMWHADMSGSLLFEALRRAAARGVRVRLLLDDNTTSGQDALLADLAAQPNVAVRLFNPFRLRRLRFLSYLTDFRRLNRRMHNKSFTVDDKATIIGGRNVGDEYFDAGQRLTFTDLDLLAIGPVVAEVERDFERYWHSASAIPVERVVRTPSAAAVAAARAATAKLAGAPAAIEYRRALAETTLVQRLLASDLPLVWGPAALLSDDPAKGLGRADPETFVWPRLRGLLGKPQYELQLVSAYFVPGTAGVAYFAEAARRGVRLAVLTNSLEATDVPVVHAGYSKRRKALLRAGVSLFEMKREYASPPIERRRGTGAGSSSASLHAKTCAVDGTRVFVGSFNFDPRSARLNTEMGLIVESPSLAQAIRRTFAGPIRERAYELSLENGRQVRWRERRHGVEVLHCREPGTRVWQRAAVWLLSLLPIEWLL